MRYVPTQIVLPVIKGDGIQLALQFFVELRFSYVEGLDAGHAGARQVSVPVEIGRELLQFLARNFVEELVRIAPLHTSEGSFGQCSLDSQYLGSFAICIWLAYTQQLHHARNVLRVLVAQVFRFLVVLRVVVPIWKAESPGGGEGDDLIR